MDIVIRNTKLSDIRYIIDHLRPLDKEEAAGYSLTPHRELFSAYKHAIYNKTLEIDGEPAAMWGVIGTLFGAIGIPYFATAVAIDRLSPLRFTRLYLSEMDYLKTLFPKLRQMVAVDYPGAIRLLKIAGFKISDYIYTGRNNVKFYYASYGD